MKRIALAVGSVVAAFALSTFTAAPAQAAPVVSAPSSYCITMAGAVTCIGQVAPSYYVQKPVKTTPQRQAQKAYIRALQIKLAQQRLGAWNANRLAR
jgi:hypothetical protein